MILKAKDLSPEQRLVLEGILGQSVSELDDISVRKLSPPPSHLPERRAEILGGLREYFARIDRQRQPVSDEEADEIINEALRSTRPNYRPVR